MKTLIQNLSAFFLILALSFNLSAQEIQIDVTFTGDTVLYPFENFETISELIMDGNVEFFSDTSMVRLILEDENGYRYMIFETYPLIGSGSIVTADEYCDETCALNECMPHSLIVQVINAEFLLKDLYYSVEAKQNAEELRYEAKRAKDAMKIEIMNKKIPFYGMLWSAADNSDVKLYYDQKRLEYGDRYNLRGYDYYYQGVFEFLGHGEYQKADPNLVKEFDWRNRHGINDSTSIYWDGDEEKAGWLTRAKNQTNYCGSCWAFASAGVAEALVNLYAARPLDMDLSEQDMVCNDGTANGCDGSFYSYSGLIYIKNNGVVTEQCYPYDTINFDESCATILPCTNPDPVIKIEDTLYVNVGNVTDFDSIRKALISRGPLKISYNLNDTGGAHAVALAGYKFNIKDSTLTFIIKDSHGNSGPNKGFKELKVDHLNYALAAISPVYKNDTGLIVSCNDFDQDGYYFWGVGSKPDTCNCDSIEDCDDNNKYVGGYDENFNCGCIFEMDTVYHHISVNTTWSDTTFHINYEVVIDSGACLTISTRVEFAPEAGILVRQGGKLILDSAYLTKVCPELWQGIDVLGSDTIQDYDEYFGKVIIRNNSIIEFAEVGIANFCRSCGYQDMQCGGMISAENSIFRDNKRDILLNPFSTYWFNHDLPYACVISDCQFLTTDNFYPDHVPQAHIEMKDIYGVMIYGCRFENQSDLGYNPFPIRGTGISSVDSYFMINRYCLTPSISPCEDFDTCKFTRLEYGIKAMNSRSKRTLNIQGLKFDLNFLAISLSGLENVSVLSNNFKCPKSIDIIPENRFTGGLFLEGCTGYHIENNEFNPKFSSSEGGKSPCYGIGVKNSGINDNEIYNNYFEKLRVGIYTLGENRGKESGLCLKCNDMIANINDFVVVSDTTLQDSIYQGINYYQGDPVDSTSYDGPAGNTFTTSMGSVDSLMIKNYNYYNGAEDIFYTHHHQFGIQVRPLDNHYTSSTIELKGWQYLTYDKTRACPSGLGGGGGLKSYSSPRSIINEADIQINNINNQLNALVDNGNTEELNFEVMTSLPDDGLEIRQDLLNASPYLSDTVLKQAIYKEDVLPNAMIRDVLEANPQSAKSHEILNTLDSRYEPMPDYMLAQIMEGKKYLGAKEILEANIQSWHQIRSKAKADLMRELLLDTNMISPLDSVIAFLENETDLDSKYDMALAQWDNSDPEEAWGILNDIPSQFDLNENQIIDHDNYLDYFDILQALADSNWQANQLDSASVTTLFYLRESENPRISALSRGLLVIGGFFNYIETINFPEMTKASKIHHFQYPVNSTNIKEDKLWLFPNPAGDFVVAYYDLDSKYKSGELRLVDLNGKLSKSYQIKSGNDQIVIDLKTYPSGLYLISLKARNQIIDSKKLSKGGN
jgi:hypothetical protein